MTWLLIVFGTMLAYVFALRSRRARVLLGGFWELVERGYQREAFLPFVYLLGPLAMLSVPVVYGYVILHLIGVVG